MGYYDHSVDPEPGCAHCGTTTEDMAAVRQLIKARAELEQVHRWLRAISLGRATREIHQEIRAYLA